MTLEQTLEGGMELAWELSRRKRVQGKGKNQCKVPKVEGCLACVRKSRGQVAGVSQENSRRGQIVGPDHVGVRGPL